jgi:hypothetical protein
MWRPNSPSDLKHKIGRAEKTILNERMQKLLSDSIYLLLKLNNADLQNYDKRSFVLLNKVNCS